MAGVSLRNVVKSFGQAQVIKGVDVEILPGEFCVFVGPSGCGKSTLLRMIAGLEDITAGTLAIGGQVVNDLPPKERGIAMVFQSYAIFPHMTVRENLGFGLTIAGAPKEEKARKVEEAARILRMEHLLERRPAQLSGGQRQRVAIGRAIVRNPRVFLFDEPLSNLDAELRVQMRIEIAALHRRLGATMIYVTHDQVEAMTLADRIVVLRAGRVEQAGAPLALYDDPDNLFVAGFIGSPRMNFFDAVVTGDGRAALKGFDAAVPLPGSARPAAGTEVVIGCRPEHFLPEGGVPLTLTVGTVEHLGTVSFAYAEREGMEPVAIEMRDNRNIHPGDRLTVGFPPGRTLLFDRASGRRLR